MSLAARVIAVVLAVAMFVAGAECACIAGGSWVRVDARHSGANCKMSCCGEKVAGESPPPVKPPVPCKSTCPHCGQLMVQDASPGFDFGLTFTAFGLSLDDLYWADKIGGDFFRVDSDQDRPPPASTLLGLHCALII